ncbi:MAG: glycogen/starch synthase [Patescibacteria group bacterium]
MKLFGSKKGLKILFVGSEAAPFAMVGGLAAVMYSLPKALQKLGHDARVFIPRYLNIDPDVYELELIHEHLEVPTDNEEGPKNLICNVRRYTPVKDVDPVTTYFLENQEYYEQRANVYGYGDDPVRWALLSRGVLEFLKFHDEWKPDIIVGADWPMGYMFNYMKTVYKNDLEIADIASLLAIHNLAFQGMFNHRFVQEMDYDDGHSEVPSFESNRLLKINALRRGIIYSDAIVTVSENHSKEILTKDFGEGLEDLLKERRSVLFGILNGINIDLWDPRNDPFVPEHFTTSKLERRLKNKQALQERFGLPIDKKTFVISIVSRLWSQKGINLLQPIIQTLLQELPIQLIVVGEGDHELMTFFQELQAANPTQVGIHLQFDSDLPHLVFSGTDAVVIPSKYEPCGLTQMEAMRLGAVPIVRKVGGLADSVEDYNPDEGVGTGFVFEKFDSSSLMIAIIRAFENFRDNKKWRAIQSRAMAQDFSWSASAKKYVNLFNRVIDLHKKRPKRKTSKKPQVNS